jgi:hypothetical protein
MNEDGTWLFNDDPEDPGFPTQYQDRPEYPSSETIHLLCEVVLAILMERVPKERESYLIPCLNTLAEQIILTPERTKF